MKHLLPQVQKYFKTNLHTHSTISDGRFTPQQVKNMYKEKGYSILALTDHNIIADHSDMNEDDFLMLTGVEINFNHQNYRPRFDGQVYHLNLISKRPDNLWIPSKPPHKYPGGVEYEEKMKYENMDVSYNVDAVNAMIKKANEKGFLVMYNHPTWSCQSYPDYANLKGLWAMELCNGECCCSGNDEKNNSRVYKDLLTLGNKLYPTGTDDMHRKGAVGIAWIMVGAKKLEYDSVISALENGDFYMSTGPEIFDITLEETIVTVKCSPARQITLTNHGRFARRVFAEGAETITKAEFDITDFFEKANTENSYILITVTDKDGNYASTRAYYLSELIEK